MGHDVGVAGGVSSRRRLPDLRGAPGSVGERGMPATTRSRAELIEEEPRVAVLRLPDLAQHVKRSSAIARLAWSTLTPHHGAANVLV